jgi:tetratricopeptide (TPR) repeat protein
MGNADSSPLGLDKPEPLMEEAQRNLSMGFYEPAVLKYRRAYDLLKEAESKASAARCLRLAAEAGLHAPAPDFELAAKAFEEVGRLNLENELTAFSATGAFANAVFALMAAGRGTTAREKFDEFKGLDLRLEGQLDGVAAKMILATYVAGNKNQTKDLYLSFREAAPVWPVWREAIFKRILERLS